jgi:nucleotide-binding universal stress UspA family protein
MSRYVVAYSSDSGGRSALALGRLFAGSGDVSLVVAMITPETWGYPSVARVDAEYAEFLASHAAQALQEAQQALGDGVEVEFLARAARSPAEGILSLIAETDARLAILGSARGGPIGRFAVGSVTNSLLHAAPVPVALAPRDYAPSRTTSLQRITCAFVPSRHSSATLAAAVQLARRHQAPLRLVTGVVRDRQMYPSLVGWRSEALVEQQWREDATAAQQEALAALPEGVEASAELVDGPRWDDALDALTWADGEVMVVGSSRLGGGSRIFLGTNAIKIVRGSPVPTVVVPGGA